MLLLDEPLGALDLKLREQMQIELKGIQRDVGITFVYVTHDQDEALTMSDRIAVFNDGLIEQIGTPAEVYERPANQFVTGFVGISNALERDGAPLHRAAREDQDRGGGTRQRGAPHRARRDPEVAYAGMVTTVHASQLETGGELQVVHQNLETSSSEALEQRGRQVTVGWRPEQAVAVHEQTRGEEPQ